jgi:hypothetical protein
MNQAVRSAIKKIKTALSKNDMKKDEGQPDKEHNTIEKWFNIQENLSHHFTNKYGYKITREEIFDALFIGLVDELNLEWQGDLWDLEMNFDEALQSIKNFDFSILNQNIVIDKVVFPSELLLNYKVRIKSKGLIWIIHNNDKDPFPSNPHAHQLENNIKLDLSNGKCYKLRKHIYTLKKKDLVLIRKKAKTVFKGKLPELKL